MSQQSYHELIYQPQDDVEDLEGYQLGGYHPVKVGDVNSDERYTIVHKLGWGSYSTVWLARDAHSSRYVALKVIIADESKDNTESRILRHLDQIQNKKFRATGFVSALLDEFYIRGPNGDHLCLVTELARCSVASSKAAHPWTFPLHSARAIAAQAILGLQEIHGKGVIHGGLFFPVCHLEGED